MYTHIGKKQTDMSFINQFSIKGYMDNGTFVINSEKRIKLIMFTTLALLSRNKHSLYHGISYTRVYLMESQTLSNYFSS